jgi:hypothetical protein
MEKQSREEEKNMKQSNGSNPRTGQLRKDQKRNKSYYAENPEFTDLILENLEFDEKELSEMQRLEIEDFIHSNTISRQSERGPFPFAAAIHLGFLLLTMAAAFFIDNSAFSQLLVSFSIIFAAMAALFLNKQNRKNHE